MKKKFYPHTVFMFFLLMMMIPFFAFHHKEKTITVSPYEMADSINESVLFSPGIISTKDDEFGGSFTPDGKTCYFSKSVLKFYLDVICYSEFKNGKWQTPKVAPFSGMYRDFDPVLSPNGNKMIFTSNRPVDGKL